MSNELKAIIYEPLKESRVVSVSISCETVSEVDDVIFNADGSVCTDFETFTENLSGDEMIGFPGCSLSSKTRKFLEEIPPISSKKLKKIERTKQVKAAVQNSKLRNKLKKFRKKAKFFSTVEKCGSFNDDYIALPSSTTHQLSENYGDSNNPINWNSNKSYKNNFASRNTARYFQTFIEPPKPTSFNRNRIGNSKRPNNKRRKKINRFKQGKSSSAAIRQNSNEISAGNLPNFMRIPWRQKEKPANKMSAKPTNANPDYIPLL